MSLLKQTIFFYFLVAFGILSASTWEPPLTVSTIGANTAFPTSIVSDSNGNAALAWTQSGEVYTSYRPFGGVWEPPHLHGKGKDIRICVDEGGNLTVAYIQLSGTDIIRTDFRPFGGSWLGSVTQYTSAAANSLSELNLHCVQSNFYGMITWLDQGGGAAVVNTLSRRGSGTGWSTFGAVAINNTAINTVATGAQPIPRIQSNGTAVCVLRTTNGGVVQINYANFDIATLSAGSTWNPSGATALIDLGFAGGGMGTTPGVFDFDMTPDGKGVVAVETGNSKIAAAVSLNSSSLLAGAWSSPVIVDNSVSKGIQAEIDKSGFATLAWIIATPSSIRSASTPIDAVSWQTNTLYTGTVNSGPFLDVSPNGGAVIAWADGVHALNALVGFQGTFEPTAAIVDTNSRTQSVSISNNGVAFAAWTDQSTGLVEASRTIVEGANLVGALGLKRLIYQKGLYP